MTGYGNYGKGKDKRRGEASVQCMVTKTLRDEYREWCALRGVSINVWTKAMILVTLGHLDKDVFDLPPEELIAIVKGK